LARAAVDQIANEDRGAGGVAPSAIRYGISQLSKQSLQLVGMTMDIADDVVRHELSHSV
jgi:hypothetical protein